VVLEFPSRRAFCNASGMPAALLDEVLAGCKGISMETLAKALDRVGYRLRFARTAATRRTA
jgi:hypothetical protein